MRKKPPRNWEPFWEHTSRWLQNWSDFSNFILLAKFSLWIKEKTQKLWSFPWVWNLFCFISFNFFSFHLIPSHLCNSFTDLTPSTDENLLAEFPLPGKHKKIQYWGLSTAVIPNLQNTASQLQPHHEQECLDSCYEKAT